LVSKCQIFATSSAAYCVSTDLQYLVLLVLGGPFWSLVLSSILQLVSLFLGLVDSSLGVLSGSVYSEQAKGGRASVDDWSSASCLK
jgi:hypothetical protein